ncbi:MAG: CinA family protein [Anaerolineae bacterium]|nr:CinA family protein [Anaerolineae bacterium]
MKAAVLAIGDELTCGYQLDTNSQFISRRLAALPADVVLHMSVGDDSNAIHTALHVATHMTETDGEPAVVVVAGGLGPTEDDLTRQAVAAYFGVELVEDAVALAHIRERFAHRGREMPESNRIQAQVPAGSRIIHNSRGTAAGFYLQVQGDRHVFVTPGVPYEMQGMLEDFVLPRLRELVGTGATTRRVFVKVYGLPESEINERIRSMLARDRNPLLGLLPSMGTITVELVASGGTPEETDALIEADVAALRAELGQHVISDDGRELPQVVADLLVARELTIAVAEVGTGGLVAARLTEPEGSERWFCEGSVLDGNPVDDAETLARALAARQAAVADIGVGVGPIVLPEDSTADNPYAVVDVAVNVQGQETHRRLRASGDRARVRQWAADGTLDQVRLCLLES